MPLYCSNTGSTALREADVQQPITDATLSLTRSFFAFSAKVGQSLPPSSWMNLILRPSTPPAALICSIASFSASTEPVSLIAIVPVTECRMPTVTSVSVTANPVVLTFAVGNCWANAMGGSIAVADRAAAPTISSRRVGVERWENRFPDDMRRLYPAWLDNRSRMYPTSDNLECRTRVNPSSDASRARLRFETAPTCCAAAYVD